MATPSADTHTTPAAPPIPGASIYLDPRDLLPAQNPRRKPVTRERIAEIADSMRKHHVLENLIVRRKGDGYQVVAGDTRQKAAIEAGLNVVPCVVRDLNDVDMLELQLIENIQRNDMHPVDEGESFERLIKSKKHTVESLAVTIGKSERWVWNRLAFTKLIPPLRDAFVGEELTASHAELLCRLEPADQKRINNSSEDDDGLWRWDFLEGIDPATDKPKERTRRAVRSVRDVNDWIEHNVRLAIQSATVQNLLPEVEEVQLEAARENARVLQVATTHMLPQNPELKGRFDGVLTERHWMRAGGKSACDFAERAVIVFGEGQGETLDVCVNKKACAKHWPDYQPAAVDKRRKDRAKQAGKPGGADDAQARHAREEQERGRLEARWKKLFPALVDAIHGAVKKMKAVPGPTLKAVLKYHQLPPDTRPADLPMALLKDAVAQALRHSGHWYGHEKAVASIAQLVGVDVKALEKDVLEPEKPKAEKKPKQKPARESLAKNVRPGVRKALAKRARKAGKKR